MKFAPFEMIYTPFESISRDLSIQIIKTKSYMRSKFEGIVSEGTFSEVFCFEVKKWGNFV